MDITLTRHSYSPTETMGTIPLPDGVVLDTIEPPWIFDETHGSRPFESCIPDGVYDMIPVESEKHGKTWVLVNHKNLVFADQHAHGRYACMIHAANWARQLNGCIAPGVDRRIMGGANAVAGSRKAMDVLREVLNWGEKGHRLIIKPTPGAVLPCVF